MEGRECYLPLLCLCTCVYVHVCMHGCSYVCLSVHMCACEFVCVHVGPEDNITCHFPEPSTLTVFLTGEWGLPVKFCQPTSELQGSTLSPWCWDCRYTFLRGSWDSNSGPLPAELSPLSLLFFL